MSHRVKIDTPTARMKLDERSGKPYPGPSLARGVQLLYRRRKLHAGCWVVKAADGHGRYWTKRVADADDVEPANGITVLTFHQAQKAALELVRGGNDSDSDRPLTVGEALDAYAADLQTRGGDPGNARRVRHHLPAGLAARLVGSLIAGELRAWRDGLLRSGMAPASVNRTRVGLRAALERCADLDPRITNRQAFKIGLKAIGDANSARDIVVPMPSDVMRIVDAAYAIDDRLGLWVHVLAETGARASQVSALDCAHLVTGALLMPASAKGKAGARKNRHCEPVAISEELAGKLRAMAGDRDGAEPLLLNGKGARWQSSDDAEYRRPFAAAVTATGLDPRRYTTYCLRHSHIVAQIRSGVALFQVANWHDTSESIIKRHYGKYINRSHDALAQARAALPSRKCNAIPFAA